jgi:acyl carrier protein
MNNLEKLNNIFCEVFSVEPSALNEGFNKDNIDGWDSVRQLSLTSSVEDEFEIMLDAEDILEFTSYEKVKTILAKYEIEL